MFQKIGFVLLAAWAVLSVGFLGQFIFDSRVVTDSTEDRWLRGELEERLTWELMILNFPMSIGLASIGPSVLPASAGGPIAEWCVFTLGGFVQWAFLLPALGRAVRSLAERRRLRRAI